MREEQLIFLISQPRSGSTLLQKLLGAHKKIYTRSEPWLMLYPLYSLKEEGIEMEYNYALGHEGLKDFCDGIADGRQKYIQEIKKMHLNLYAYYVENTKYEYFLDKTPRYYFVINELLEVFPNAKFILLIRNPLAVLGSIINTWTKDGWFNLSDYKYDLIDAIDRYVEVLNNKNNVHIVHYEDLISNTDSELRRIFDYLNIEYVNTAQTYYESNEKWLLGDQVNVYLKKGVDENNAIKWQEKLNDPQYWRALNDYLDCIGREKFEKIGYDFEENKAILESRTPKEGLLNNTICLQSLLGGSIEHNENLKDSRELSKVKIELSKARRMLEKRRVEIDKIYSSQEWRIILFLQLIVKRLVPCGSYMRKILKLAWGIIKSVKHLLRYLKRSVVSAILFCGIFYYKYLKPRRARKINKYSKKIVYIGHSYHNKTKSTEFLIKYLKEFFDVEVVLDESWQGQGQVYPDLSFIDESYLAVIFFQNLPERHILKKIKNANIIFFPMYDGVRHDYGFWSNYYNLKIINFSTTLHKKLMKWGLDSLGIQYFPQPQEFISGNKNEVFFWNRISQININTLARMFEESEVKIHIHKAIDPGHRFVHPSAGDEKKFSITYSNWFETRNEMQEVIEQKGIYVAPREFEGIGMSFLEAMALGKAVVAVDNPTMNEYIKHGKTGYLFDLKNPKKIDLSNIREVQKNAYKYMQAGYQKWETEKHKIIDFIKKQ